MYQKSVNILNKGIEKSEDNLANLYYNRACSYIKMGITNLALRDLNQSIIINPDIADYAKKDEDFKNISESKIFKQIVGV